MSKMKKLIKKLKSLPKDMTYDELASLLGMLGFQLLEKGKTSGSRVMFINDAECTILIHKPHPQKEMAFYQIKYIVELLEKEGLI